MAVHLLQSTISVPFRTTPWSSCNLDYDYNHHAHMAFEPNQSLICRRANYATCSFSNSVSSVKKLSSSASVKFRGPSNQTNGLVLANLLPFLGSKDSNKVKGELLATITLLDRGAEATDDDLKEVNKIAQELEALNPTKEPLNSPLLNGRWELVFTTSESILKKKRPKLLRPNGPIYQAINTDTLRAQNMETWPFFNQVTANLTPVSASKVIVKFDVFKLGGLVSIKAPGRARGELEITYLDDQLRVSRGDKGNLFVLLMNDPSYRIPQ